MRDLIYILLFFGIAQCFGCNPSQDSELITSMNSSSDSPRAPADCILVQFSVEIQNHAGIGRNASLQDAVFLIADRLKQFDVQPEFYHVDGKKISYILPLASASKEQRIRSLDKGTSGCRFAYASKVDGEFRMLKYPVPKQCSKYISSTEVTFLDDGRPKLLLHLTPDGNYILNKAKNTDLAVLGIFKNDIPVQMIHNIPNVEDRSFPITFGGITLGEMMTKVSKIRTVIDDAELHTKMSWKLVKFEPSDKDILKEQFFKNNKEHYLWNRL